LAAMREAIDSHVDGHMPTIDTIIAEIGPLTNKPPTENDPSRRKSRRGEFLSSLSCEVTSTQ
ncbi:MAG: hypothetical protein ACKODI_03450, partial [Acidimicrobiaceae bacterium]